LKDNIQNNASLQTVIAKLEAVFDVFNKKFFGGKLEHPVISVSPDTMRGAYGWCTSWKAWQGKNEDGYYEINLCAEYLARPFEATCQTLLHEMVHLQNLKDNIQDTSRSGKYHNKRFKETAEKYGLCVEKSEKYGYCITNFTTETARWFQAEYPNDEGFALHRDTATKADSKKKSSTKKYVCPVCSTIVRATKTVNISCADCEVEFIEEF